jgi:hypothetical protein
MVGALAAVLVDPEVPISSSRAGVFEGTWAFDPIRSPRLVPW